MSLLTDGEIKQAIQDGEIQIDPFDEKRCLQPASYDMRLGRWALLGRAVTIESFKKKVKEGTIKEIDLEKENSITIPAGAFCLLTTYEKLDFGLKYVGHIGMRSYLSRKGLNILSGLQIDPGYKGVLILGVCNISPRSITLDHCDPICTIEIHRLAKPVVKGYPEEKTKDQQERRIPATDKDYLRTIETMSINDLTEALISLATNVENLSKNLRLYFIPLIIGILTVIIVNLLK